ncbi:MAG: NADH-quinone oxidoreductase subunit G [Alphaproteobacteria bacterium GM7ARS4]|nr:NADH-quinone oxidoreductase subunit G [Alphaproteobacteria bacterium GM7ARS4]
MARILINRRQYQVEDGITIFQACQQQGIEIPHFCYHERLAIAGNCRMCLVQLGDVPKPVASCAMPVSDGMDILTESDVVKKARHGVMEFLLINHPLDCPICDQGGECDLQDQAMMYGRFHSRFPEHKRAVPEKSFGPLIKSSMTRCIHCTRCVRFATDIAGVEDLGTLGRGENAEIGTYVRLALTSELSGNMIDLCPVGALTSKPYAFRARSWELKKTESIDVMDAVGSHIRLDSRGQEVMRVLPRPCSAINEEWISDKVRFSYDGLRNQRLDRHWVRDGKGVLRVVQRETALQAVADKVKKTKPSRMATLAGDLACCESLFALKRFLDDVGCPHRDCRPPFVPSPQGRRDYVFNTTIAGIDDADGCLLIGAYPRFEATLIEARLRQRWLRGGFEGWSLGMVREGRWPRTHVGDGPTALRSMVEDERHPVRQALKACSRPMLIVGMGALMRPDSEAIWAHVMALAHAVSAVRDGWDGVNVLPLWASSVGGMDLGFMPSQGGWSRAVIEDKATRGAVDMLWLLGVDDIRPQALEKPFVVYQGHHGERGAQHADVILPAPAYSEKDAWYMNMEGRLQRTSPAVMPLGDACEEWETITALASQLSLPHRYDDKASLRNAIAAHHPAFAERVGRIYRERGQTPQHGHGDGAGTGTGTSAPVLKPMDEDVPFDTPIENYYHTNIIARASSTMGQCIDQLGGYKDGRQGEGDNGVVS